MCGPHRLTSLKCGHLFGHSCIKRWLQECPTNQKTCPSCKKKSNLREFRFLYAKKICIMDNSEEIRLKDELQNERTKYKKLEMDYSLINLNLRLEKQKNLELIEQLDKLKKLESDVVGCSNIITQKSYYLYKVFLDKNIDMGRDSGCRVIAFNKSLSTMLVSQKSNQPLFPGFGVRFIDMQSYRPNIFLHMSSASIRDIAVEDEYNFLVAGAREKTTKIYNLTNKNIVSTISLPNESQIWSCCFDCEKKPILYLGSERGIAYAYDIRNSNEVVKEFNTESDLSPIISIASLPSNSEIQFGGFVLCKLRSIWFFEFTSTQDIKPCQLNIEGPFISMSHEENTNQIVISTRPSSKYPHVRYIIGKISRLDNDIIYFKQKITIKGATGMQMMIRSTLVNMPNDQILLCGYTEDTKLLTIWNTDNADKIQSISVNKVLYDVASFKYNSNFYLSGITESDVKIFKFNEAQ